MEFDFRQIVTIIGLIVLIIVLIVIGFSLRKTKDPNWPPDVPACPDYWEVDGSGNCMNKKSLGQNCNNVNFTTDQYAGSLGPCKKYNWAKGCGVAWDGITYGAPNPCDISKLK